MARSFRRGDSGYEAARRATSWLATLPDRFPDVIVQAETIDDICTAVRTATREHMRIGVCSGGSSWSVNHLRDGGMLLDVSRLDTCEIDTTSLRARVGPGLRGNSFDAKLAARGLFFPVGHCQGVCLGGYLLQGGFGWNSRALGPACMSVEAIDYVDADGQLRHASERDNAEMLWAARGAGPGFFGVVVRFWLRLYPRPRFIGLTTATYSLARLDEVFRFVHAVGPEVPRSVELLVMMARNTPAVRGVGLQVVAIVFEDSWRAARRASACMRARPRRASLAVPIVPVPLRVQYRIAQRFFQPPVTFAVDNMWTHAPIDALLPGLQRIADTLPDAPSHMQWLNWAPPLARPDMAFALEDQFYIGVYGAWREPSGRAAAQDWATARMTEMQALASGCQLADENLGRRPSRFTSDDSLARLDRLRAAHDPEQRFHAWMGRPTSTML